MFREFERLANAARTAPGLGLGLSIVERLSKVLNHQIRLRSTAGQGSVFSVELPVVAAQPLEAEAPEAPCRRAPAARRTCVLAIDNEPRILEGMKSLLTGWGCRAVVAGSEMEAGAHLARLGILPDVLIADYHLDDTNGLELIPTLRDKIGAHLPAILITADRTPEVRDRAAALDIRVLNKPLKPAALRSLLSQWRVMSGAAE